MMNNTIIPMINDTPIKKDPTEHIMNIMSDFSAKKAIPQNTNNRKII